MHSTLTMSDMVLEEIPPLQLTSQRIMQLITDQDVDLPILAGAIEEDPVITARLLSIANSAYYAPSTPVSTVSRAVIDVLGMRMVKALVLGMIITDVFDTSRCQAFSSPSYWVRALATAQCAHRLSGLINVNSEEAYLAGLLHNVGSLYFAHVQPAETTEVINTYINSQAERALWEVEKDILGHNHCEVGEALARHWKLPLYTQHVLGHYIEASYRSENWQINSLIGFTSCYIQHLELDSDELPPTEPFAGHFNLAKHEIADQLKTFPNNYEGIKKIAEFLATS